ncbi:hypothetical protein [Anaeromyxobacter dehalogenans]|uniref:Uncharacterized protein n=1 Tax=Anaeromyxobacter dehalogenans (strain 2CP-C) TaxID=290397 RepID=Q2IFE8_ANADE|nr:hypothetical protein [Anaeromyxobacter dehalogenans]ABC83305.1 hypothetical protein Adeh_3539 [Anaeromyxobacter dehalogenans 2CP-C]
MTDKRKPFVEPVLRGARFADAQVPVDVLADLVAYRDLVLRVAKELFKQRYGRARVPKGFESSFQLALQEIRPGSAVLALKRTEEPQQQGVLAHEWDPFDAARDLVTDYVDAIGSDRKPPEFPENVIPLFGNFGKHLRPGEELVLDSPGGQRKVSYNQEVRKRIVLQRANTYQKDVELVGTVVALDKERGQFRLRTDEGAFDVEFSGIQTTQLANALRDDAFTRVELAAVGSYDRNDALKNIDEVRDLNIVDVVDPAEALRIERRLDELLALKKGWSDGEHGEAPSRDAVDWARQVLLGLMARDELPQPHLYATEAGHIRAEWTFDDWEVSAEFNFAAELVSMEAVNVKSGDSREAQVSFVGAPDEDIGVSTFVNELRGEVQGRE